MASQQCNSNQSGTFLSPLILLVLEGCNSVYDCIIIVLKTNLLPGLRNRDCYLLPKPAGDVSLPPSYRRLQRCEDKVETGRGFRVIQWTSSSPNPMKLKGCQGEKMVSSSSFVSSQNSITTCCQDPARQAQDVSLLSVLSFKQLHYSQPNQMLHFSHVTNRYM